MENVISRPMKVDVQQSGTSLELSYGMKLSSLRGIERLFVISSTLISLISSYLVVSQQNFMWLLPAVGFISYPTYTVLIRCLNKWYISLDNEDVYISSGPIPTGADKLLMRSMIDRIYSRAYEDYVDIHARLKDGRVIRLVRNLPVDVGIYLRDQIEDFITENTDDENYEDLFHYEPSDEQEFVLA